MTKELECESNQSVVDLDVYTNFLRQKGQDLDKKALAKALKARRSVILLIKEKERRAFGPVQLTLLIDFVEIVTTAWVVLDDDLVGQIFVGRNELSLRAVGRSTGKRGARIDGDATMIVQVRGQSGTMSSVHGMLDTGAGVSVMSVEAWQELRAPLLKQREDEFLLGRTFIRDFDVLIDLSKNSILIRDPMR